LARGKIVAVIEVDTHPGIDPGSDTFVEDLENYLDMRLVEERRMPGDGFAILSVKTLLPERFVSEWIYNRPSLAK